MLMETGKSLTESINQKSHNRFNHHHLIQKKIFQPKTEKRNKFYIFPSLFHITLIQTQIGHKNQSLFLKFHCNLNEKKVVSEIN